MKKRLKINTLYSQILCAALYKALLAIVNKDSAKPDDKQSDSSIASILSEAVCSIDEDNKHTDEIDDLVREVRDNVRKKKEIVEEFFIEDVTEVIDDYLGEIGSTEVGRNSLDVSKKLSCSDWWMRFGKVSLQEWWRDEFQNKIRKIRIFINWSVDKWFLRGKNVTFSIHCKVFCYIKEKLCNLVIDWKISISSFCSER